MYTFKFILLITVCLHLNYSNANIDFQNNRTKRQGDVQICAIPNIPNGKIKTLTQKFNSAAASSYLLLNITCDHNYILYPPNNNIILCVNGFWEQEIPQCIQCGQRADNTHKPFIVNGTLSKFGDFPWHVGIYKKEESESRPLYICGGSIINEKTILTVAHCFTDDYGKTKTGPEYFIGAGKYYSNYNSDKDKYAQKRKVARIDIHPQYEGYFASYAWDIAVVIVDEPFKISNLVQPICVDWNSDFENEQLIPNNIGEIAGWGTTETHLVASAQELRVLKVPFIKPKQCTKLVPKDFIRYITPDKFCAGYTNGSSICGGDSGGGLVFKREENLDTRFYIRGLVSVGVQIDGRCDDYKYSTYTRVSEYLSFIQDSFSNNSIPTTSSPYLLPPKSTPPPELTTNTPTINLNQNIRSHRNFNLLPSIDTCGIQNLKDKKYKYRGREARGEDAELGEFPWMSLLEFILDGTFSGVQCAGVLINNRYVLTAAHCVPNKDVRIRVRFGEHAIAIDPDCNSDKVCNASPVYEEIEEVIVHPSYNEYNSNLHYDIALFRLKNQISFTDFISPICLPINGERTSEGKNLTIAGWGTDLTVLRKASIQYDARCEELVNEKVQLIESQFCAGYSNTSIICEEGSGGPLMSTSPESGRWYTEGIFSFNWFCGSPNNHGPSGITRVSSFLTWILDSMRA